MSFGGDGLRRGEVRKLSASAATSPVPEERLARKTRKTMSIHWCRAQQTRLTSGTAVECHPERAIFGRRRPCAKVGV